MKKLILLISSLLLLASLSAQKSTNPAAARESLLADLESDSESGSVSIKKCQDFKITGDGSSAAWNITEWIKLVHQGSDFIAYETKAKVLYSETGIYFLYYCQDEKLTSTMKADNLNLWEEDVVELFFMDIRRFSRIL